VTKLPSFLLSSDAISLIAAELVVLFSWVFERIVSATVAIDPQYSDHRETILLYSFDVSWRISLLSSVPVSVLGILLLCLRIGPRPGFLAWVFLLLTMLILGSIYIVVVKGSPYELQMPISDRRYLRSINYYQFGTLLLSALNLAALVLTYCVFASEHHATPPKPPVPQGSHLQSSNLTSYAYSAIGPIGPFEIGTFDSLEGSTKYTNVCEYGSLSAAIDMMRKSEKEKQLVSLFLIGSADKFSLHNRLKQIYGSNEGLARARAEWVETQLIRCQVLQKDKTPALITITTGPAVSGDSKNQRDTAADRTVMIYAWWVQNSQLLSSKR
jgi:hypothetical protein